MSSFLKRLLAGAILSVAVASNANALVFVGQWEVDDGPWWTSQPLAYTGQEAAALLFGGVASDYVISTIDANPANADHMAWYSVLGLAGGHMFAEDYVSPNSSQAPGYYYSGAAYRSADITEAASAYVGDNASGPQYTNYAFRVPEPGTLALLGMGLAGLAATRRRKH